MKKILALAVLATISSLAHATDTVSWLPVTTNVDGTAATVKYYKIFEGSTRAVNTGNRVGVVGASVTSFEYTAALANHCYAVLAEDAAGKQSDLSDVACKDSTPAAPPPPPVTKKLSKPTAVTVK